MRLVKMSSRWLLSLLALAWLARADEEKKDEFADLDDDSDDTDGATDKKDGVPLIQYAKPDTPGLHFAETFDGEVFARWQKSKKSKYNGEFKVDKRKEEALLGDQGLLVPDEARHYGIATKFNPIKGEKGKAFVLQYETRFQDDLSCGGSYMKLFDSSKYPVADFDNETPYIIMFGPDRCGATDKVHFILKHKNPKTGDWEEKHYKNTPSVPHDRLTHLYRLVIRPDNSFEVSVDGKGESTGNLLTDMEPPVNPPKEIDDPVDKKPADWVDDAKIDDPESAKPDDWDEKEPRQIADPASSMPDGWKEDAPKQIADPEANKPGDWDDDEDGEWEAPMIDNPDCKVGCGKWIPPQIDNPKYKGKWYAPKIDNPSYKGEWHPRKIDNPNYFLDEEPYLLPTIDALGFDLWTMQGGIMFDNIVIDTDIEKATDFADKSFKLRKEIEELQKPKISSGGGLFETATSFVSDNVIPVAITSAIVLMTLIWFCCFKDDDVPAPPSAKRAPKKKAKAEDEKEKDKDEQEEKKEEKEEKDGGGIGEIDEDS